MKLKELTIGAMLTALAIIIPIQFSFLRIVIPPFSATLAAHVPMLLSMLISPPVALMVGVGSTIGFLLSSPVYVAARAASHIVAGYVGAVMIKHGKPAIVAYALTLPIHAVLEVLAVIPFGWTAYKVLVVVGAGTVIHHIVDSAIALSLAYALQPFLKPGFARR
ncbi:MAG: ECF transporter S component [Clostridiales bacterium]|nr:ECF transporter S component [Clostridiales bacterium]HBM79670.1 ECF transporter S component [Clostridiaceae bacterium]